MAAQPIDSPGPRIRRPKLRPVPNPTSKTHKPCVMDGDDRPGQITAAIESVCLRFKKTTEPLQGQLYVKCEFVGRGGSFFVPTPEAVAEGRAPAELGSVSGSSPAPPLSVRSQPVDIIKAIVASEEEGENSAPDDVDNVADDAVGSSPLPTDVVAVDVDFSLDTIKFDLTEHNLSILSTTEIKLQLYHCSGGGAAGDDAETVIGTASVRVAAVLNGKNEWTDELALGTYVAPAQPDVVTSEEAEAGKAEGKDEPNGASAAICLADTIEDASAGPLEFGGSTSTVRVTLLTNDETADYTVGAGSLWTDGAEVTGVPDGWKVVPPPETERSAWNEVIATILSGESVASWQLLALRPRYR